MKLDAGPVYLYRCFDQYGTLLYVGITTDIDRRMGQHTAEKFWWVDVARRTHMAFKTREQALWAEWAVISTCHPLHNHQIAPPSEHKCPAPPPPPLAIDGYAYMRGQFSKVAANKDAHDRLTRKLVSQFPEHFGHLANRNSKNEIPPLGSRNRWSLEELHDELAAQRLG